MERQRRLHHRDLQTTSYNVPNENLVRYVASNEETPPLNHRSTIAQETNNDALSSPKYTTRTIETSKSTIESTIETLMSSTEFNSGTTEEKIIELLKIDSTLTLDQLFPLLNMSRKGVQKAIDRLKVKGILTREGSTKAGRWIVNENS